MKPRQELTQQTYVGRFWRFVNFNTNQTIGGYCGIPGYIDAIIKDKDVTAVEGNRKYLQSAIKQLNLWPTPSNALQEESQPSLAVNGNWITNDSEKRLISLPDEYGPTCYTIDQGSPCPLATLNPFGRELLHSDVLVGIKRSTWIDILSHDQ
jgi:hypothetical protein